MAEQSGGANNTKGNTKKEPLLLRWIFLQIFIASLIYSYVLARFIFGEFKSYAAAMGATLGSGLCVFLIALFIGALISLFLKDVHLFLIG